MANKKRKFPVRLIIGIVFVIALVFWGVKSISVEEKGIELIPYTEYTELLEKGEINTVVYHDGNKYMTVSLHNEATRKMTELERETFDYSSEQLRRVYYPEGTDFKKELLEKGVIAVEGGSTLNNLFDQYGTVVLYLAMLIGLLVVMRKTSVMSLGNDIAMQVSPEEIKITFDDVIGHEEIKDDLKLLVKQLKNGDTIKDLSHGVLFEGETGTGKTMLAKAIAKEAGVNFISVNSSALVQMYIGLGAKRVRDVFDKARKNAPCVLFFDEIDAVGEKRGNQRSHRENDQTINALLTEMDGFNGRGDILVIAATNRADSLDDALVRAGRFDRKVRIGIPRNWETRQRLFDHYLQEYKIADDVDTSVLAKQTTGFSGADIASICREARLVMFSKDKEEIAQGDLEEAIDKIVFKGNRLSEETKRRETEITAFHEAGHAVMCYLCKQPVSRISIMGMTSGTGGAVFMGDNEKTFKTKNETETQIMIAYAGRASEEIRYGRQNVTQGASNDISKATALLKAYVMEYGFDESMGLLNYNLLTDVFADNQKVISRIDELSCEFYKKSFDLLVSNYDKVQALAERLIDVKTMSEEEMKEVMNADE